MSLKGKLYWGVCLVHAALFALSVLLYERIESYLVVVELVLIVSLIIQLKLINKALQPLAYIDTFSNLLNEQEFNARFSRLNQSELDRLIDQFNRMLSELHNERLAIGEHKGVFDKLMAESPIGLVLLDFEHRVSDINRSAQQLLDVKKSDIEGQSITSIGSGQIHKLKSVDENHHEVITIEQGRWLKVGHYIIRDRGFNRSFYLVYEMTSDIIESQKSAYEKLIRLMSHEVNNTIAITNSLLQSSLFYKEQLDTDSKSDFEQAIEIVIKRCASLNEFMQGYADVVKLEAPIKSKFNLTKLVQDLAHLIYAKCEELNIKIAVKAEQDFYIQADASLIEQALINVLKNAIEAIGSDGHINIELSNDSRELQLKITDDGAGISQEAERQLFTPFYTSKESGQGVGLMLIREVFNLHNCPFVLANNEETKGACFSVQFETVSSTNR